LSVSTLTTTNKPSGRKIGGDRTLYEILGVKKDATKAAIRAAYRKLVIKAHPDAGGTKEEFEELTEAMVILCDEDKRRKYDATGNKNLNEPDNLDAIALQMVLQAIYLACDECSKANVDPMTQALQILAMESLKARLTKAEEVKKGMGHAIVLNRRLLKAWARRGEGDNQIATMIRHQMVIIERNREKVDQEIKGVQMAKRLLAEYDFLAEQSPMQVFVQVFGNTSTIG